MKITQKFNDTHQLKSLLWISLLALILVSGIFGGFYYWDRYIHLNDKTPLEAGIRTLKAEAEANPEAPEPRLALAEYYLQYQSYSKAIEQATQVLNAYPDSDRALLILGMANKLSGDTELGVAYLERFTDIRRRLPSAEIDPALQMSLYHLGDSYLQLNRPADAQKVLSEAITISASDADSLYLLGKATFMLGKPDEALIYYQHAVRFVPDYAEAYAGMVDSYTALNEPDYAAYAQGMQAFSQKDYQKARDILSPLVERLPDYAPVYIGLGMAYEQLGDLRSAETMLERAVGIDSSDFTASNALARVQTTLQETP